MVWRIEAFACTFFAEQKLAQRLHIGLIKLIADKALPRVLEGYRTGHIKLGRYCGRISGNNKTSRMEGALVSSITIRSIRTTLPQLAAVRILAQ